MLVKPGGTPLGASVTTAVAAESAALEPAPLVAVTRARSVESRSAAATRYVEAVAPVMFAHAPPPALQRNHWWEKLVGLPYQVPVVAESDCPT